MGLKLNLRPRMAASPLCDADRFVRDLEAAFRTMWRAWCEGRRQPRTRRARVAA